MFSDALLKRAARLLEACKNKGIMLATAESCTGGLIAALLTEIAGSSCVFERGFVTYSNAAKRAHLGVPTALIKRHGAVSAPVAAAMAKGALAHSEAQVSIAVTGIAGPSGGTKQKPVGLVYIAVATHAGRKAVVEERRFEGSRATIRMQTVRAALTMIRAQITRFS